MIDVAASDSAREGPTMSPTHDLNPGTGWMTQRSSPNDRPVFDSPAAEAEAMLKREDERLRRVVSRRAHNSGMKEDTITPAEGGASSNLEGLQYARGHYGRPGMGMIDAVGRTLAMSSSAEGSNGSYFVPLEARAPYPFSPYTHYVKKGAEDLVRNDSPANSHGIITRGVGRTNEQFADAKEVNYPFEVRSDDNATGTHNTDGMQIEHRLMGGRDVSDLLNASSSAVPGWDRRQSILPSMPDTLSSRRPSCQYAAAIVEERSSSVHGADYLIVRGRHDNFDSYDDIEPPKKTYGRYVQKRDKDSDFDRGRRTSQEEDLHWRRSEAHHGECERISSTVAMTRQTDDPAAVARTVAPSRHAIPRDADGTIYSEAVHPSFAPRAAGPSPATLASQGKRHALFGARPSTKHSGSLHPPRLHSQDEENAYQERTLRPPPAYPHGQNSHWSGTNQWGHLPREEPRGSQDSHLTSKSCIRNSSKYGADASSFDRVTPVAGNYRGYMRSSLGAPSLDQYGRRLGVYMEHSEAGHAGHCERAAAIWFRDAASRKAAASAGQCAINHDHGEGRGDDVVGICSTCREDIMESEDYRELTTEERRLCRRPGALPAGVAEPDDDLAHKECLPDHDEKYPLANALKKYDDPYYGITFGERFVDGMDLPNRGLDNSRYQVSSEGGIERLRDLHGSAGTIYVNGKAFTDGGLRAVNVAKGEGEEDLRDSGILRNRLKEAFPGRETLPPHEVPLIQLNEMQINLVYRFDASQGYGGVLAQYDPNDTGWIGTSSSAPLDLRGEHDPNPYPGILGYGATPSYSVNGVRLTALQQASLTRENKGRLRLQARGYDDAAEILKGVLIEMCGPRHESLESKLAKFGNLQNVTIRTEAKQHEHAQMLLKANEIRNELQIGYNVLRTVYGIVQEVHRPEVMHTPADQRADISHFDSIREEIQCIRGRVKADGKGRGMRFLSSSFSNGNLTEPEAAKTGLDNQVLYELQKGLGRISGLKDTNAARYTGENEFVALHPCGVGSVNGACYSKGFLAQNAPISQFVSLSDNLKVNAQMPRERLAAHHEAIEKLQMGLLRVNFALLLILPTNRLIIETVHLAWAIRHGSAACPSTTSVDPSSAFYCFDPAIALGRILSEEACVTELLISSSITDLELRTAADKELLLAGHGGWNLQRMANYLDGCKVLNILRFGELGIAQRESQRDSKRHEFMRLAMHARAFRQPVVLHLVELIRREDLIEGRHVFIRHLEMLANHRSNLFALLACHDEDCRGRSACEDRKPLVHDIYAQARCTLVQLRRVRSDNQSGERLMVRVPLFVTVPQWIELASEAAHRGLGCNVDIPQEVSRENVQYIAGCLFPGCGDTTEDTNWMLANTYSHPSTSTVCPVDVVPYANLVDDDVEGPRRRFPEHVTLFPLDHPAYAKPTADDESHKYGCIEMELIPDSLSTEPDLTRFRPVFDEQLFEMDTSPAAVPKREESRYVYKPSNVYRPTTPAQRLRGVTLTPARYLHDFAASRHYAPSAEHERDVDDMYIDSVDPYESPPSMLPLYPPVSPLASRNATGRWLASTSLSSTLSARDNQLPVPNDAEGHRLARQMTAEYRELLEYRAAASLRSASSRSAPSHRTYEQPRDGAGPAPRIPDYSTYPTPGAPATDAAQALAQGGDPPSDDGNDPSSHGSSHGASTMSRASTPPPPPEDPPYHPALGWTDNGKTYHTAQSPERSLYAHNTRDADRANSAPAKSLSAITAQLHGFHPRLLNRVDQIGLCERSLNAIFASEQLRMTYLLSLSKNAAVPSDNLHATTRMTQSAALAQRDSNILILTLNGASNQYRFDEQLFYSIIMSLIGAILDDILTSFQCKGSPADDACGSVLWTNIIHRIIPTGELNEKLRLETARALISRPLASDGWPLLKVQLIKTLEQCAVLGECIPIRHTLSDIIKAFMQSKVSVLQLLGTTLASKYTNSTMKPFLDSRIDHASLLLISDDDNSLGSLVNFVNRQHEVWKEHLPLRNTAGIAVDLTPPPDPPAPDYAGYAGAVRGGRGRGGDRGGRGGGRGASAPPSTSTPHERFGDRPLFDCVHHGCKMPHTSDVCYLNPKIATERATAKAAKEKLRGALSPAEKEVLAKKQAASAANTATRHSHLTCYNCALEGHIAQDCPEPPKAKSGGKGTKSDANAGLALYNPFEVISEENYGCLLVCLDNGELYDDSDDGSASSFVHVEAGADDEYHIVDTDGDILTPGAAGGHAGIDDEYHIVDLSGDILTPGAAGGHADREATNLSAADERVTTDLSAADEIIVIFSDWPGTLTDGDHEQLTLALPSDSPAPSLISVPGTGRSSAMPSLCGSSRRDSLSSAGSSHGDEPSLRGSSRRDSSSSVGSIHRNGQMPWMVDGSPCSSHAGSRRSSCTSSEDSGFAPECPDAPYCDCGQDCDMMPYDHGAALMHGGEETRPTYLELEATPYPSTYLSMMARPALRFADEAPQRQYKGPGIVLAEESDDDDDATSPPTASCKPAYRYLSDSDDDQDFPPEDQSHHERRSEIRSTSTYAMAVDGAATNSQSFDHCATKLAAVALSTPVCIATRAGYVDTGASITIVGDRDMFVDYQDSSKSVGSAVGSVYMRAVGEGLVSLPVKAVDGSTVHIDVVALHCPQARYNLVSINGLIGAGMTVTFGLEGIIQCSDGRQIQLQYESEKKLWRLDYGDPETHVAGVAACSTRGELWHARCSHLNFRAICRGSAAARGMPTLTESEFHKCKYCMTCKAKKGGISHLSVEKEAPVLQPLALVHIDLSGPMRTTSLEGHRWSIVIVDDFSKKIWVLPIAAKSDVTSRMRVWLIMANSQSPAGYRVKRTQTDNGMEFISTSFKDLCIEFKITQTFSNAYQADQNPVVERAIGSLNSLALTAMTAAAAPAEMWSRAQNNSRKALNSFPKTGEIHSPDGLFFQQSPDVSLLAPFGCRIVAHRPKKLNDVDPKWHAISISGVYIGPSDVSGKKGYALLADDGVTIYNCVSARLDMELMPWRAEGDQRVTDNKPRPDAVDGGIRVVAAAKPADASTTGDTISKTGTGKAVEMDDEDYDLVNDERFRFENGSIHGAELLDRRVVKDFVVNCVLTACNGVCVSLSIDSDTDGAMMRVVYDDGDSEDYTYDEFKAIMVEERSAFLCFGAIETDTGDTFMADELDVAYGGPSVVPSRREMLAHPAAKFFLIAEGVEVNNMFDNKVFQWMFLPEGERTIGSKFTYKIKTGPKGEVIKYKARLVAKGYQQIPGVDYGDTSAPVAGATAFRMLVCIALLKDWKTYSWDVDAAFLHGELDRKIYMRPPSGYVHKDTAGKVILLRRTIYGLKQAAAEWWTLLSRTFIELGYTAVDPSSCFWMKENKNGDICLACHHVDDLAVTASCDAIAWELRDTLKSKYGITDQGPLSWHLGMSVRFKYGDHACINQSAYIQSIIKRFGMTGAKPVQVPMSDSSRISLDDSPAVVDEDVKQTYMELVGSLNYLSYQTRPDLAYACSQLGTVLQNPGPTHLAAAKRVVRYLIGTPDLGLIYRCAPWTPPGFDHAIKASEPVGFTDADWAGCLDSRLSTTSYLTFMAGGPISWKARKQKAHASSSAESELIAMAAGARDLIYVRATLKNLRVFVQTKPTVLMSDSSAAIAIADKPGMKEKTKHIALRYFQIRELQRQELIKVRKIGTDFNPSDLGTKALGPVTFLRHLATVVGEIPAAASSEASAVGSESVCRQQEWSDDGKSTALAVVDLLESTGWELVRHGR